MDWLVRELRLAVRRARKEPALTAVVVLTLGLAIGSGTAILGVVNAPDGSISQVTVRAREFNVLAQATTGERGPFAAVVGLEDAQVTLLFRSTLWIRWTGTGASAFTGVDSAPSDQRDFARVRQGG